MPTLRQLLPGAPQWRILTDVSVISLLALVVVLATRYVLYRTPFGLRLRSVGENPEAADAAGVRVNRIRYTGVVLSGVLAGVGGAYLSIGQSSLFTRNMTAGPRLHRAGGADLRQVASRADDARVRAVRVCGCVDDSDAGRGEASVRRGHPGAVRPDDSLRRDHRRAGRLHRPVARAARARRATTRRNDEPPRCGNGSRRPRPPSASRCGAVPDVGDRARLGPRRLRRHACSMRSPMPYAELPHWPTRRPSSATPAGW